MNRALLALLAGLAALGSLGIHSFIPALPAAAISLGAPPGALQLTVTLYLLGMAVGQLLGGWGSDHLGRRKVTFVSLAAYLLGALAGASATSLEHLLAARIVQALGGGSLLSLSRAVVVDQARGTDATRALATLGVIGLLSPALAPLLGGALTDAGGWRLVLSALASFCVPMLLGMIFFFPKDRTRVHFTNPWLGFRRLLFLPTFWRNSIAGAATSTGLFAFLAASSFIFNMQGLTARQSGFAYLTVAIAVAAGALITRRAGNAALRVGSIAYAAGGMILLMAILMPGSPTALILPMMIVGVGTGLAGPAALAGALQADQEHVGTASSLAGALQMATAAGTTSVIAAILPPSIFTAVLPVTAAGAVLLLLLIADAKPQRAVA